MGNKKNKPQPKEDSEKSSMIELQLELSLADAQKLCRLLDENESLLPGLSGYYEVLYEESRPKSEKTRLFLFFAPESSLPDVSLRILLSALGIDDFCIHKELLKEKDYLEAYKKYYTSFFVTPGIQIIPSWEMEQNKMDSQAAGSLPLYLDPGLAFGTGKHPTTQLCLAFLEKHSPKGKSIVDAGCGSGILSIGALLLGAKEVFAFDIDANAVRSTKSNLLLNNEGFSGHCQVAQGGFDLPALKGHPASLWIANLTASILVQNSEAILQSGAQELLLSGIILEQEEYVRSVFEKNWRLSERQEQDGWVLLYFKRAFS